MVPPSAQRMKIITASTAQGSANTAAMAKNLPSTMPHTETGLVSSSWSVRLWRSSASERIASTGI